MVAGYVCLTQTHTWVLNLFHSNKPYKFIRNNKQKCVLWNAVFKKGQYMFAVSDMDKTLVNSLEAKAILETWYWKLFCFNS